MGNASDKHEINHDCQLPPERDIITNYIPADKKLRIKFRKACLMSDKKSHGKIYVKSRYAIEKDRAAHLASHYYIIHPFSDLRYYWEVFMIVWLFLKLISVPFLTLAADDHQTAAFSVMLVFQVVCLVDICMKFASGYFERAVKEIVLDPKKIAIRYLRTWFFFDLISSLPIQFMMYMLMKEDSERAIRYKAACAVQIVQVCTLVVYMERIREKRQYSLYKFRTLQIFSIFFIGLCWIMCFLGLGIMVDKVDMKSNDIDTIHLMNIVVGLVFSLGHKEITLIGYEFFVHILGIVFGLVMRNILIVQILLLFKSRHSSRRKYVQLIRELEEYMHFKLLPLETRKRIIAYYNFLFQHMYYNEKEIWDQISDRLRSEIEEHLFSIWRDVDIFKKCPPEVIKAMLNHLKREIYLTNDVIYTYGTVSTHMYFIKCGCIALYTAEGKEYQHVEEGTFIQDTALLKEKVFRTFTAVAAENCELYKLSRRDFLQIMRSHPELYAEISEVLKKRVKILERMDSMSPHVADEQYFGVLDDAYRPWDSNEPSTQ